MIYHILSSVEQSLHAEIIIGLAKVKLNRDSIQLSLVKADILSYIS